MANYIIGSGWWCADGSERDTNPNRKLIGDDKVRAVAFFEQWLSAIQAFTLPSAIVVVDSNAPRKPDSALRRSVKWVELPFNAKHAADHLGQWSGWLRSTMVGGNYALASEADYFVYIEQDCLVGGVDIIEHCIEAMTKGIMFGSGEKTPQPIQQSFFIIKRQKIAPFLKNLADLKGKDKELSPEWKFVFATWRPFVLASNLGLLQGKTIRKAVARIAGKLFYDELPLTGGRTRPIKFEAPFVYFQHGSLEEIDLFASHFLPVDKPREQPSE